MDRPFVGLMDEVALYDRPLTIEEIQQHHRLGRPEAFVRDGSGVRPRRPSRDFSLSPSIRRFS